MFESAIKNLQMISLLSPSVFLRPIQKFIYATTIGFQPLCYAGEVACLTNVISERLNVVVLFHLNEIGDVVLPGELAFITLGIGFGDDCKHCLHLIDKQLHR